MNKTEFLEIIHRECGFLPGSKRRQITAYFSNLLRDYDNDTDVSLVIGNPEEALRSRLDHKKTKSSIPKPLFIIALLLLAPIALEVAFIVFALLAVFMIFMLILLLIIPLTGILLWLDGIEIIFRSIPQAVILADKLWQIGIGFMQFAAGIVILVLVYKLYSKLIPWILGRFSALYHRIEKRRTK